MFDSSPLVGKKTLMGHFDDEVAMHNKDLIGISLEGLCVCVELKAEEFREMYS